MAALQALQVVTDPSRAAALMDPLRLRLVEELAEPESASGLARRMGEPRQRINYHLRELEKAGLVRLVEERKKGNCVERMVVATARTYLVSPEVLGALGADATNVRDRLSSAYLIAVCADAIRDVATLRARAEREGKNAATLTIQTEVRFGTPESMSAFASEAGEALARIAAKHHDESSADGRLFKFFLGGYSAITRNDGGTPIGESAPPAPASAQKPSDLLKGRGS